MYSHVSECTEITQLSGKLHNDTENGRRSMDLQLGLDLFDSDSEEQSSTSTVLKETTAYIAKVERSLWFLETSTNSSQTAANVQDISTKEPDTMTKEDEETLRKVKSKGDYFYFQKQFDLAVGAYEDLLILVPQYNKGLKRQIRDSLARGYSRMGNYEKALEYAEHLVLPPHTEDVASWLLMAGIHSNMSGHTEDTLVCKHRVVQISSSSPVYWMELYSAYVKARNTQNKLSCVVCSLPRAVAAARETIQMQFSKLFELLDCYSDGHLCEIVMGCCLLWTRHILISSLRTLDLESNPDLHRSMEEVKRQIDIYSDKKLLKKILDVLNLLKPANDE